MIPLFNDKIQYIRIKDEINEEVLDVLESGQYLSGRKTVEFEQRFAGYIGVKHAVSCASGSDALVLALTACGVSKDDEVITTPFAPFAAAAAIARVGAVPVFADIDTHIYNIDAALIEKSITAKTKAILPAHAFGQPADMESIRAIAKKYGLHIIEDASQAAGAEYNGDKAGSLGDLGCFSFAPGMNLSCCGNGGMVTTNDDTMAITLKALRSNGEGWYGRHSARLMHTDNYNNVLDLLYNNRNTYKSSRLHYVVSYNSTLDEIQAAILLVKLKYLECWNDKRIKIAEYYTKVFESSGVEVPETGSENKHVYNRYVININHGKKFMDYLNSRGIASEAACPVPLHLQPALRNLGYKHGDMPVAEELSGKALSIPIYPDMLSTERDCIVNAISGYEVLAGERTAFR